MIKPVRRNLNQFGKPLGRYANRFNLLGENFTWMNRWRAIRISSR